MTSQERILITGASGLVGGNLAELLADTSRLMIPIHHELDITNRENVNAYIEKEKPTVIIHAAAFVDPNRAEQEVGDKTGVCWQVNVEGTRHIMEAAIEVGAFVIYISTGSVFTGTASDPGPFTETDLPEDHNAHPSWYGTTKREGERLVKGAIVRLSHPVGGNQKYREKEYLTKIVKLFDQEKLYPLFPDQLFPLTSIPELGEAVGRIIKTKNAGVYHIASPDLTSPLAVTQEVLGRARGFSGTLPTVPFTEFITHVPNPSRYSQYSAIACQKTQEILSCRFSSWRTIAASFAALV